MTFHSSVSFIIVGEPAPQGSKRTLGNGIMVESSKKVKPWRQDVAFYGREAMAGRPPLDGPLMAEVVFTLPKPKSSPKRRVSYPCRKPDIDKLLRSTLDALVTGGVIADDSRIVRIEAAKAFPGEHIKALTHPGAWVKVWGFDE